MQESEMQKLEKDESEAKQPGTSKLEIQESEIWESEKSWLLGALEAMLFVTDEQ